MWALDRSASRGFMECRGLYVFSHDSDVGNAPAHVLFKNVDPKLRSGVQAPRSFDDYEVTVEDKGLPAGVQLTRLV